MVADTNLTRHLSHPPLEVVPGETDAAKATRFKKQIGEALESICEIMTTARKDNITLGFNVAFDAMGRAFVADIKAVREL